MARFNDKKLLPLFVTMSSASGSARESIPTQLVINAQTFAIPNDPVWQMLLTPTNKTDDEAFNCRSTVESEEILNDDAK